MEIEIIEKVKLLREALLKNSKIKEVKRREQLMLANEEVGLLIMSFQAAQEELKEAMRFKLKLKPYQQKLSQAKEELYQRKEVKDYLEALKVANSLLKEINDELFTEFSPLSFGQSLWRSK